MLSCPRTACNGGGSHCTLELRHSVCEKTLAIVACSSFNRNKKLQDDRRDRHHNREWKPGPSTYLLDTLVDTLAGCHGSVLDADVNMTVIRHFAEPRNARLKKAGTGSGEFDTAAGNSVS